MSDVETLDDLTDRLQGFDSINAARTSVLAWATSNPTAVAGYVTLARKHGSFRIYHSAFTRDEGLTISVRALEQLLLEAGIQP